jgi:hypothetical protein
MHDLLPSNLDFDNYKRRIQELLCRKAPITPPLMKGSQKYLYDVVKKVAGGLTDKTLLRSDIEAEFKSERKPLGFDFNNRENLITDFCYNMVNIEDNEIKFLICVGAGRFQFKDLGWACPDGVDITWNVARKGKRKVGEYKDGKYCWKFSELDELIAKSRGKP